MSGSLFLASVSGHYVKEFQTFVGRGGIVGLKREVYIKLSRPSAALREISTMIRVDNFFRGWFGWKTLNEHRIRMIIESIQNLPKDQLFGVGFNELGSLESDETKDALLKSAKSVLKNHDYPLCQQPKRKSSRARW